MGTYIANLLHQCALQPTNLHFDFYFHELARPRLAAISFPGNFQLLGLAPGFSRTL